MNLIEKCLNDQIDEIRSLNGQVLDSGMFLNKDSSISVYTDCRIKGEVCHLEHTIS